MGPIENYYFQWGSNRHSFDPSQKKDIETTVLVRHLWASSKIIIFHGVQIVLTWSRKNSMEPNVLGTDLLPKSAIATTSTLPFRVVQRQNEKRWWLCQVWAPSKITIFDGAQIDTVVTRARKKYSEPNVLVRHLAHPNNI